MQQGTKKILKVVLYIILGLAFCVSWYFSYLYLKSIRSTKEIPPEILKDMQAPRTNLHGNVKLVGDASFRIENFENKKEYEIKITEQTAIQKVAFDGNKPHEAKKEDIKEGLEINVTVKENTDNNELTAEVIQIIIPPVL